MDRNTLEKANKLQRDIESLDKFIKAVGKKHSPFWTLSMRGAEIKIDTHSCEYWSDLQITNELLAQEILNAVVKHKKLMEEALKEI